MGVGSAGELISMKYNWGTLGGTFGGLTFLWALGGTLGRGLALLLVLLAGHLSCSCSGAVRESHTC